MYSKQKKIDPKKFMKPNKLTMYVLQNIKVQFGEILVKMLVLFMF